VKFSPSGAAIAVSLQRNRQRVQIVVSDTGSGISAEFLPHVFDRFRQQDASSTRRQGGLGLGLNIARQLVELHGGNIEAYSDGEGKGATFTVNLPLGKVRTSGAPRRVSATTMAAVKNESPESRLSGRRILLVEDEPETQKALGIFLRQAGATVVFAESAEAGFEAYVDAPPSMIVSDIALPGENGYSLMERIRRHEKDAGNPPTPAIALSAFTREEDKLAAVQAGFDRHLSKPIDPEILIEALSAISR
jgi:CheY-like chemotaxis protein